MVQEKDTESTITGLDANYMCPNSVICLKEFSSLAGLLNHLESKSCGYSMDFDDVQRAGKMLLNSKQVIFR
jgi:hypothetical protein